MNYRKLTQQEAKNVSFKKELTDNPQLLVLDGTNEYFNIAQKYADEFSSDPTHELASIIVKVDKII
ncbi:MAG: hypothetical protein U9Q66_04560 [Patescibacteria group bacterium]|nr:hypothetical protein [Patescibacteria group bacterium]